MSTPSSELCRLIVHHLGSRSAWVEGTGRAIRSRAVWRWRASRSGPSRPLMAEQPPVEADPRSNRAEEIVGQPAHRAPDGPVQVQLMHPVQGGVARLGKPALEHGVAEEAVLAEASVGHLVGEVHQAPPSRWRKLDIASSKTNRSRINLARNTACGRATLGGGRQGLPVHLETGAVADREHAVVVPALRSDGLRSVPSRWWRVRPSGRSRAGPSPPPPRRADPRRGASQLRERRRNRPPRSPSSRL